MADIYLYTEFYKYSAENFAKELDKASGEVTVRLYSAGGSPTAGYTMLAKMKEHGQVSLKVDGYADSMAAFMLCYAKGVECLDISTFTFHRAAYPSYLDVDEPMRAELNRINSFLRAGLEKKVGADKFQEVTGTSLDEMFSMDGRIDVTINAEQAKEMGLVDTINEVTNEMIGAINSKREIAAETTFKKLNFKPETKPETKAEQVINSKSNKMTIEKLRAEHPEVFNEAVALGVSQEKDRVGSWLAFNDVDPEAVSKGIKEGESLSQTAMAEFSRKALSAEALKKIEADNSETIETEEQEKELTAEQKKEKEIQATTDKVLADLGISKN